MTVLLTTRRDITLEAYRRVAWEGEGVVGRARRPLALMDRCAESFAALVRARVEADPGALIYGVTTAPGDGAAVALDAERLARRPTRLWTGGLLRRAAAGARRARDRARAAREHARRPRRRARRGRARGRRRCSTRAPLPVVPAQGNGGAGEILALGTLFFDLSARLELTAKERMALINGSPCAAALVADVALAGARRVALAERVFALSSDAIGAPEAAYGADLEALWDDEHETAALRSLRALLAGSPGARQRHQAPVSYRILPRVLGAARRALAAAERAAAISLRSVSDNPVYIPPDAERPLGTVFSTGGYHNSQAPAAIDSVAAALGGPLPARRASHRPAVPAPGHRAAAERGRMDGEVAAPRAELVGRGGALACPARRCCRSPDSGRTTSPRLSFLAWRKATAIGRCLDGALAALAVMAAQALHVAGRGAGPQLDAFAARAARSVPGGGPRERPARARLPGADGRLHAAGARRRRGAGAVSEPAADGGGQRIELTYLNGLDIARAGAFGCVDPRRGRGRVCARRGAARR